MAVYSLPDLPYDYSALEPVISGRIMELHHSKHHQAYVTGANTALEQLAEAREKAAYGSINALEKNLAFHLGGHANHSVFWTNMSPNGGGQAAGDLAAQIDADFGSFDAFKAQFQAVAVGIQGSGWAILGWDSIAQKLLIVQLYDQQANAPLCITPLLMLDMWEHAFYLDYVNDKAAYATKWWDVVDWSNVAERYATAKKQTTGLIVK